MMTTESITVTAARVSRASYRGAGFRNALASEWVKLTTVRSTYVTLGLGVVLSIAMTAVVCAAVGSTFDGWPVERQAKFTPILMSVSGEVVALIAFSVFGVLAAAGEYSSGMIRLTLAATPNRGRVFAAKLLLVSSITMAFGLINAVGMFFVGQAVLGSYGIPVAHLGDADALRMVIGLGVAAALFPTLGLSLVFILRSTAGAITGVMGLLWLPQVFGQLLPEWAGEHILSLFPQSGADSITVGHLAEAPIYSAPAAGAVIVATWLAVLIVAAYVALTRRDA